MKNLLIRLRCYINLKKVNILVFLFMLSLVIILNILPFSLLGERSFVEISDNLDQFQAYYRHLKNNDLLITLNASTALINNLEIMYFSYNSSFNIQTLLFYLFDTFTAYVVTIALSVLIGYISMLLLLKTIFIKNKHFPLLALAAISYASLATIPVWQIPIASIPLIVFIFIKLLQSKSSFNLGFIFLATVFPFISFFPVVGIFNLIFWFTAFLALTIRNGKVSINLLIGGLSLFIGYLIVDFNFFYMTFFGETLHRVELAIPPSPFLESFFQYFLNSHFHARSNQLLIIIPIGFIILLLSFKYNFLFKEMSIIRVSLLLIVLNSSLVALYSTQNHNHFVDNYLPILSGFDWSRIGLYNRLLWYLIFAATLIVLANTKFGFLSYLLAVSQIIYILVYPTPYNDTRINYLKIFNMVQQENHLTYREYYSSDLFELIKEDLQYNDERVVALGFHPAILIYNDFKSMDGYMVTYPLDYKHRFRLIIHDELEQDDDLKLYFDNWGSKIYIFSSELGKDFLITKDRNIEVSDLKINTSQLNEMGIVYLISSVRILNYNALELDFVNQYEQYDSPWRIFVYKVN